MTRETYTSRPSAAQSIAAWHKEADTVNVGDLLELSTSDDSGQFFEVVRLQWTGVKGSKRKSYFIIFSSECVVCGKAYQTKAHRDFKTLTRTCPDHRRKGREAARPALLNAEGRVVPYPKSSARVIRETVELFKLIGDKVKVRDMVDYAAERMPPPREGERDTRTQRAKRALSDYPGVSFGPYYAYLK